MNIKIHIISVCALIIEMNLKFVCCQDETPKNIPQVPKLSGPLAVGGMMKGLLNMQIRPEGGFYEEKYKSIFKDDPQSPAVYESVLNIDLEELLDNGEPIANLSEDGKLLKSSALGRSSNPCFEFNRLTRNRLLALVCSLQLRKNLNTL